MNRAFLSHSSKQKNIVKRVAENLGKAQCVFDEYEFESGLPILEEIIKGLNSTELFVVFLSEDALNSEWVQKEILIAKDKLDTQKYNKIFPVLIDSSISVSTDNRIPIWMKEYLLKPLTDPFIISKKIRQRLREISIESNPLYKEKEELFVGRNEIFDALETTIYSLSENKPNSIIVSGLNGIGRRTFLKTALKRADKIKQYYEPIYITLDTKDSIEDFIIKLQDIENENTSGYLEYLKDLSFDEKVKEAESILNRIQESNEFIFVIDSGCIIMPTKHVAEWFLKIVRNQKIKNIFTLSIISRFRPSNELLKKNSDIVHFSLNTLSDRDTEKLFVKYSLLLNLDLDIEDSKKILSVLNGVPSQIYYAIDYIKKYGIRDAVRNINDIIDFGETQVFYLIDLVKSKGQLAYDLLILLSYLEFISYDIIYSAIGESPETDALLEEFYIIGIYDLVGANKEYIKVHYPIRDYISRSKVKLNPIYSEKLKEYIKNFIKTMSDEKEFSDISELLFSVKGAILEGHKLPDKYYVPSFVLKTIVELYYKGNYKQVISLIDNVLENQKKLDESLIREFYYWLCLSLARRRDDRFDTEIQHIDGSDYDYLYGFYYRFKKMYDRAIIYLKRTVGSNPNFQRARRELVNVYLLKEDYLAAIEIAKDNYENQKLNAFHIQAYFLCLVRKAFLTKEDREKIEELFKNIERSFDSRSEEIHNVMKGEYQYYIKKDITEAIRILRNCLKTNNNKHIPVKSLLEIYQKSNMSPAYNELKASYKDITQSFFD